MGRPSKLTPELCEQLFKEIREGMPEGTAAQLLGLDRTTLFYWKKRAKESKRKNKYTDFFNKLEASKAYANKKHLRAIMDSKDWKARKYLLSLNDKNFNDTEKVELKHSGEVTQEHKGKVEVSIHDEINEYEQYFTKIERQRKGNNNPDNNQE